MMSFCKNGDDLLSHKARANERVKACLHTKRVQPRFVIILNKKRVPNCIGTLSKKAAMTYSPTNLCSTIGAVGLNFSVRNGKRWIPDAIDRLNIGKQGINLCTE